MISIECVLFQYLWKNNVSLTLVYRTCLLYISIYFFYLFFFQNAYLLYLENAFHIIQSGNISLSDKLYICRKLFLYFQDYKSKRPQVTFWQYCQSVFSYVVCLSNKKCMNIKNYIISNGDVIICAIWSIQHR